MVGSDALACIEQIRQLRKCVGVGSLQTAANGRHSHKTILEN